LQFAGQYTLIDSRTASLRYFGQLTLAVAFEAAGNSARMTTRLFTFGLACSLLAIVAGNYLLEVPASFATANALLTYGAEGARLLAWGLLVSGGTIIGTSYFRLALWLGGLLLLGVLLKTSHYPGASELLLGSLGGLILTYAVRFARKPAKGQFDVVKLLLVLGTGSCAAAQLLRLAPYELRALPPCLLALAVLDFLYLENQKRTAEAE
jgi:hypothetical protein